MLNLSRADEAFVFEMAGWVEEYLSGLSFGVKNVDRMFRCAVAGGRRARPVMVLLACEAVGGDPKTVLPAAVAVELGHKASLIHDDLVDGDEMRRGRPSFWKKHGVRESVVVGDLLLGRAFSLLEEVSAGERARRECYCLFSRAYETMAFGQAKDMEFERLPFVPLSESMRMIYEKTAVLCEMPMRLGGVLGGGTKKEVTALGAYGRSMGIAFQILNDVNNVTGFERRLGRGGATDLSKGKKTSVVSYALERARESDSALAGKVLSGRVFGSNGIRDLVDFVSSAKTVGAVSEIARGFMSKACASLTPLRRSRAKDVLLRLSDPAVMRLGGYFGLLEGGT